MKKKNIDKIEKKLNLIQKKGDLYDVISKKRNATPDTLNRKLVKIHTLIFSRILYLLLVITRHFKNNFSPVKKIKNIQDEIRQIIGVPIDIFHSKEKTNELSLIYCDYNLEDYDKYPDIVDLIYDLERIANFAKKYNIDSVYIEKYFLTQYLSDEFLWNFKTIYQSDLLKKELNYPPSFLLLKAKTKELDDIIAKLKENKYDTAFIYSLKNKLKNENIKKGIMQFKQTNNAENLLNVIKHELNKIINEESTEKDRLYGKVHNTYEIGDVFIRKTTTDVLGNFISQNIITLYSFLEVINYSHLEKNAEIKSEDQELKLISLLYLHLLGEKQKEQREKINIHPLYDYIYNSYIEAHPYKKIPWINTFFEKRYAERRTYLWSFFSVFLTYIFTILASYIPNNWLPLSSGALEEYNNFLNKIKSAYEESSEFEDDIKKSVQQYIEKLFPNKAEKEMRETYQKEVQREHKDSENGKLAEIEWFTKEKMPLYFIDEYSSSGEISDGEFCFSMSDPSVNFWDLVNTRPLFQIKCSISKEKLTKSCDSIYFHLPLEAYPVGDDYAIVEIYIKDETDPTKYLKIDCLWNNTHRNELTEEEKELLRSIQEPMIYYIYGLSNETYSQVPVETYYNESTPSDIKKAILDGLGLEHDATDEEINKKLAEKEYTKYPLYNKKKDITETEYYKKIASLDAIDIDIARILTTMANENSMYVTGFKNSNDDNELTLDEAYIWVISEDGEIIDFLSNFTKEKNINLSIEDVKWFDDNEDAEINFVSNDEKTQISYGSEKEHEVVEDKSENDKKKDSEEDNRIEEILTKIVNWSKQHHLSYYAACFLVLLVIKKLFGKKIKYKLEFVKTNNIITSEDFVDTYKELFNFVYGEEIEPTWKTKNKMLDTITNQFYAFSEDDIDSLLEELKPLIKTKKESDSLKKVAEVLKLIPFIKENKEALENYKPKKLTLGGRHEK